LPILKWRGRITQAVRRS